MGSNSHINIRQIYQPDSKAINQSDSLAQTLKKAFMGTRSNVNGGVQIVGIRSTLQQAVNMSRHTNQSDEKRQIFVISTQFIYDSCEKNLIDTTRAQGNHDLLAIIDLYKQLQPKDNLSVETVQHELNFFKPTDTISARHTIPQDDNDIMLYPQPEAIPHNLSLEKMAAYIINYFQAMANQCHSNHKNIESQLKLFAELRERFTPQPNTVQDIADINTVIKHTIINDVEGEHIGHDNIVR